jgi:CBS-domain-containing membrane protein|tara:strand:+ start:32 stop:487 length:456 start_codon:yes stop_codon:yes gene_type:complete
MKFFLNPLIAAFGSFLCITLLSFINSFSDTYIWLIPPFGATMILVMAVHESPLAQPKNIFFGHVFSGLSGLLVLILFGDNIYCLGLGVAVAIFIMMITKTIHPPAGGNPLIVILGSKSLFFILMPLALSSIIIIIFAILYNRSVGRKYPFK